jgi:adenylate kinase
MAEQRFPTVLLFGAPGIGKGTQGRILGQIPGFHHLSSGDMFRSFDEDSPVRDEIRRYTSRGELVPDELTVRIWKKWLDRQVCDSLYNPQSQIMLLDGIPRSVKQCDLLQDCIDVLQVVYLLCPNEDLLVQRIRGRALEENRIDDADENVIRRRFDVYRQASAPLLKYYDNGIVSEIDPMGTPAEVLHRILDCLVPVQKTFLQQQSTASCEGL